ncbi:MAG: apolipoprotein N-acyltransferase [Acidimicrobiia bacterium]
MVATSGHDVLPVRSPIRLAAALGSGLLLSGAFPPFDLGLLALVALAPLLWCLRLGGARWGAACGVLAGLGFFGSLLSWSATFGLVAYLPFVVVMSLYWGLCGAVCGWFASRRCLNPWTASAIWVLAEWLRERWPWGGFSWGEVGYAFHDVAAARSVASLGGVLLLSFLAVLVNAVLVEAVLVEAVLVKAVSGRSVPPASRDSGARMRLWGCLAVVGAMLAVGAVLGPDAEGEGEGRLRVAVIQGNRYNRDPSPEELASRALLRAHLQLTDTLSGPLDLVVLPEASLDDDPRRDPFLIEALPQLARRLKAPVLANAQVDAPGGRALNTNFFYDDEGRLTGTYSKQFLVPFGEFVPLRNQLGFVSALQQVPRDYLPGPGRSLFPIGDTRFGSLICFESGVRSQARGYVREGARLLVVSTNNRSFGRTSNSAQHLALAQLRAAETGRPVVQAGISGPSALIDRSGRLLERTDLFELAVRVFETRPGNGTTVFVALGDWIVVLAFGLAGLGMMRRVARRAPSDT